MKIEYLRNRYNGRAFTGATAMPIANSISEAHVMQRYLRPDLLLEADIPDFDTWAGTFGELVTEMDVSPTPPPGGRRPASRGSATSPNSYGCGRSPATSKPPKTSSSRSPISHPRADGKRLPDTVVVEARDEVLAYVKTLGERAE